MAKMQKITEAENLQINLDTKKAKTMKLKLH